MFIALILLRADKQLNGYPDYRQAIHHFARKISSLGRKVLWSVKRLRRCLEAKPNAWIVQSKREFLKGLVRSWKKNGKKYTRTVVIQFELVVGRPREIIP
ncbi:hypothetical protein [Sporomusa sp. KB1]|jgi:hypothetical protein|uniref:hypothetical protein n=1 Tax=Sporomusa sp. KB1 TaxID=943346 RepID=UPI001648FE97|nr:hypothetical protein [Sporomusa sp. KB1]